MTTPKNIADKSAREEALEALDYMLDWGHLSYYEQAVYRDECEEAAETIREALTRKEVDIEALKREIFKLDSFSLTMQPREAVDMALDHLIAQGILEG